MQYKIGKPLINYETNIILTWREHKLHLKLQYLSQVYVIIVMHTYHYDNINLT